MDAQASIEVGLEPKFGTQDRRTGPKVPRNMLAAIVQVNPPGRRICPKALTEGSDAAGRSCLWVASQEPQVQPGGGFVFPAKLVNRAGRLICLGRLTNVAAVRLCPWKTGVFATHSRGTFREGNVKSVVDNDQIASL
jgi:hypothetical protein